MTTQFNVPADFFENADVSSNKLPDFVFAQMVREASVVFQLFDSIRCVGPNRDNFEKALLLCRKLDVDTHKITVRYEAKKDNWVVEGIQEMAKHYARNERDCAIFMSSHPDKFGFGCP